MTSSQVITRPFYSVISWKASSLSIRQCLGLPTVFQNRKIWPGSEFPWLGKVKWTANRSGPIYEFMNYWKRHVFWWNIGRRIFRHNDDSFEMMVCAVTGYSGSRSDALEYFSSRAKQEVKAMNLASWKGLAVTNVPILRAPFAVLFSINDDGSKTVEKNWV